MVVPLVLAGCAGKAAEHELKITLGTGGDTSTGGDAGTGGSAGMGAGAGGVAGALVGGAAGTAGQSACVHAVPADCPDDLSTVGTGDFEIAFELTTSATALSAVLSQRSICTHAYFWDIRLAAGHLDVELDDENQHYTVCNGVHALNDGMPHWIDIKRQSGTLTLEVDCAVDTTCAAPTDIAISLPGLQTGLDPCVGGGDGTVALVGTVDNECVRPL
jgi:hypothetical protein